MAEKENVLTLAYDLILYATPKIGKYPRQHKFTLGDRTQEESYVWSMKAI